MSHCETCGCKLHPGRRGGLAHYGSFEACTRIRLLRAALEGLLRVIDGGHSTPSPDGDQTRAARAALGACVPPEPGK
jgi:hypothetical protein